MYAQLILDVLIVSAVLYLIWRIARKAWAFKETPATLELKIKELNEQRKRLEELEKEVETTKAIVDVRRKLESVNEKIAMYETMMKKKGTN